MSPVYFSSNLILKLSIVRLLGTPVTIPFLPSLRSSLGVFVSYLERSTVYRMAAIMYAAFCLLKFLPSPCLVLPARARTMNPTPRDTTPE